MFDPEAYKPFRDHSMAYQIPEHQLARVAASDLGEHCHRVVRTLLDMQYAPRLHLTSWTERAMIEWIKAHKTEVMGILEGQA